MHCALQKNTCSTRRASDRRKSSFLRNSGQLISSRPSSKEQSSLAWRKTGDRVVYFTFLILESDGQWKLVALPLQCHDNSVLLETGGFVKMDGVHLIFPASGSSDNVENQKMQRDCLPDTSSDISRGSSALDSHCPPENKITEIVDSLIDSEERPTSSQSSTDASDMSSAHSNIEKSTRKKARRKARKKGKQRKELSCHSGFSEPEAGTENHVHQCVAQKLCICDDAKHGQCMGQILCVCNDTEPKKDGVSGEHSSSVDKPTCTTEDLIDKDVVTTSGNGTGMKDPLLIDNFEGEYVNILDRPGAVVSGPVSLGSDNTIDVNTNDSDKTSISKDDRIISPDISSLPTSRPLCHHSKDVDSCDHVGSGTELVSKGKGAKQVKRTPRSLNGVWQKVEKNSSESICESKKSNLICNKLDNSLSHMKQKLLKSKSSHGPKSKSNSGSGSTQEHMCSLSDGSRNGLLDLRENDMDSGAAAVDTGSIVKVNSPPSVRQGELEQEQFASCSSHGRDGQMTNKQKWVAVKLKEPDSCNCPSSSEILCDNCETSDLDVNAEDSKCEIIHSPEAFTALSTDPSYDGSDSREGSSSPQSEHSIQDVRMHEGASGNHMASSLIDPISNELVFALKNVSEALSASETFEKLVGSPVAEIERFLCSTSPVISGLSDLCCTPSFSLRNLWQWYEKHGSYGLEVKVEDLGSFRRPGIDLSAFQAYFVPHLSAVQIFGKNRTCSEERESRNKDGNVSESSCSSPRIPILSVLIPRSCAKSTQLPEGEDRRDTSVVSWSDDSELLFEYFETEQPQRRRPLFEMMQELITETWRYNIYGDPTRLACMDTGDIHPRSWYSVAWYPVYRIPDGNFRAAFLTYHSFGHMVHGEDSVAYPAVGLQSYNAQDECWFKERPSLNAKEILKERLTSLEHAASLLARAEVYKGKEKSSNRHPDYEFFLSRRR